MRRLTCLLITAAAVLACAPAAHAQTVTPPAACPGTFQVLHNDTIGTLSLKAGAYTITVQNPSVLSCATASSLLTRFLEDFDGVLPGSWVYDVATGAFVGSGGRAFTIAFTGGGGGGGGGGGLCPSTFQVLHDDSIGALSLPAGPYTITVKGLSCAAASTLFTRFLQDFDGVLPRPWRLNSQTGRFTRSRTVNFRVKRATGPSGGGGGNFPNGRRCGGAPFSIDATTTIAGLKIRAGAYRLYVLRGSCNGEEQALGRILNLGRLPSAWTLNVQTAQFNRNGKGRFYIQRIIG